MKKKIVTIITFLFIIITIQTSTFATDTQDTKKTFQSHTIDEITTEADDFINRGKENPAGIKVDNDSVKNMSDTIFNILLGTGIVITVVVSGILGIQFMVGSMEDKAKIKERLAPFIIGCVVIFGAFVIWKVVVTILGNVDGISTSQTSTTTQTEESSSSSSHTDTTQQRY